MTFKIKLSYLNKESVIREIVAENPYVAITKALHSLELVERNTIKGVSIEKFD